MSNTLRYFGYEGPYNSDRAAWAEHVLAVFCEETGLDVESEKNEAVSDLIANLGHYCDVHALDFLALASYSIGVWDAEKREEENGEHNALYREKKVVIELHYRI